MKIVKPGTPIITIIGNIKGFVVAVCIYSEHTQYQISYFAGSVHNTCWIYRYEFEIDNQQKGSPGLKDFNTGISFTYNSEVQLIDEFPQK